MDAQDILGDDRAALVTLRISVARIAQTLSVDNELAVTGQSYERLRALAMRQDRGWNDLAGRIVEEAETLRKAIRDDN